MNAATTRPSQYTQPEQVLYVAFELSSRTWKLGISVGFGQKARERRVRTVQSWWWGPGGGVGGARRF